MEALQLDICSHEELLNLDQSQQYTAISNNTMFAILSNSRIATAIRLWLMIRFQQSGFKDRGSIERPVQWFAKKLNVSKSTIQKWQRLLEQEGFLEITEQKQTKKENKPNRYRATLPKLLLLQLEKGKSRKSVYTKYTKEGKGQDTQAHNQKERAPVSLEHTKREKEKENNSVSILDNSDLTNNKEKQRSSNDPNPLNVKKCFTEASVITEQLPRWLQMSLSSYQYEIDQQTQTLWVTGVNQFAIKLLQEQREAIATLLQSYGYTVTNLAFNRDQKRKEKQTQNSGKPTNAHSLERASAASRADSLNHRNKANYSSNPDLDQGGNRTDGSTVNSANKKRSLGRQNSPVSDHTSLRISKRLRSLHINGDRLGSNEINQLRTELIYAIEKGSLGKYDQPKAINIGLKLIKENRWRTPSGYSQEGINT